MKELANGVFGILALDPNRKFFDALIPLPLGTSYNSYLIQGSEKIALIDTVDPSFQSFFEHELDTVPSIDYVVANHAEQDHSGLLPLLLQRYPRAVVLCSVAAKELLMTHTGISPDRIQTVVHDQTIDLGGKTLRFLMTPWVHWPETMVTYLPEQSILFSCDLFGAHIASEEAVTLGNDDVYAGAKRYYAEIMMPFRQLIKKYIDMVRALSLTMIAPSHGQMYSNPSFILDAYADWVNDAMHNLVVIPYVTMHGSTELAVNALQKNLESLGVQVKMYNLSSCDLGELASDLVDAATCILAAPTLFNAPHPTMMHFLSVWNVVKPKCANIGFVGSYGWANTIDTVLDTAPFGKANRLTSIMFKGLPTADDYQQLEALAKQISELHRDLV